MVVEELEQYGIHHTDDRTAIDPSPARLIEKAVSRGEGILTSTGADRKSVV